jgi:hypothetical protein
MPTVATAVRDRWYTRLMLLADTDDLAASAQIAWVCHGCHARYGAAQECCPGELVARHDIGEPCEDCALPEILDDE